MGGGMHEVGLPSEVSPAPTAWDTTRMVQLDWIERTSLPWVNTCVVMQEEGQGN